MRGLWKFQFVLMIMFGAQLRAQLAITEVMPASKPNTTSGFHGAEYWELTNFGTNNINLHGYGFRDSNPLRALRKEPFTNLVIHAGESIVFFRIEYNDQSVTTPAGFRAWWGDAKLPQNLQCRTYEKPGLSAWDGDAVWLFDASGNVVDSVQFARARPGRALTYDSATGFFGVLSTIGVDGAWAAELADDVGSPGITAGPVPVRVLRSPLDQSLDVGMTATLVAEAAGLPRPHYEWFFNDLPIPNATTANLVLPDIQPSNVGRYHVLITNNFSSAISAIALLTVNTNPTPPSIIKAPMDAAVFTRQTAAFSVLARGVPPPTYQWQTNGVNVSGAVGATFEIPNAAIEMSGIRCSVVVSNALGSTNVSAALIVTYRPNLRFTELMARPANAELNQHFGWFELTNFDTNAVNLLGWRCADEPSFVFAFTITNSLILQPGESVVFAERLDANRFAAWWGADNLPPSRKIYTYSGFGLDYFGDTLFLWNPAARDPDFDVVATVSWPAATAGVSFECDNWYDPEFGSVADASMMSIAGSGGAFRAADGGDIASPGYIANPPPRIMAIYNSAVGEVTLRCRVSVGRSYRLQRTASLTLPSWEALPSQTASDTLITLTDHVPNGQQSWCYRLEELP